MPVTTVTLAHLCPRNKKVAMTVEMMPPNASGRPRPDVCGSSWGGGSEILVRNLHALCFELADDAVQHLDVRGAVA